MKCHDIIDNEGDIKHYSKQSSQNMVFTCY